MHGWGQVGGDESMVGLGSRHLNSPACGSSKCLGSQPDPPKNGVFGFLGQIVDVHLHPYSGRLDMVV